MNVQVIAMEDADWPAVREIHAQGIATGNATFETDVPSWDRWNTSHHAHSRLIARDSEQILGWAALSPVSSRQVYAGVAEVSIYVADGMRGHGIGKALLDSLIASSERNQIWTLQAGIFPENTASVAFHKACGFREVGIRCRIGRIKERWRDVLLLERRSLSIGS